MLTRKLGVNHRSRFWNNVFIMWRKNATSFSRNLSQLSTMYSKNRRVLCSLGNVRRLDQAISGRVSKIYCWRKSCRQSMSHLRRRSRSFLRSSMLQILTRTCLGPCPESSTTCLTRKMEQSRICNMSLPASQRLTMMSFAFTNPNLQSLVFRSKSLGSGHLSHQLVPVLQDWWWGENLFPVDPMR